MNQNRWYDRYPNLARDLEALKELPPAKRSRIIRRVRDLVFEHDPTLIDRTVLDYPLSPHRRRWYDTEPILWMTVNGLKYGGEDLIARVEEFFSNTRNEK